jgi:hypothetical protein
MVIQKFGKHLFRSPTISNHFQLSSRFFYHQKSQKLVKQIYLYSIVHGECLLSQNLVILTAVTEINAKMSSDDSSTHFSLLRLTESVSAGLELEVDLLCQKIVGFKSVGYQKIL